jgi:hypothetical protein
VPPTPLRGPTRENRRAAAIIIPQRACRKQEPSPHSISTPSEAPSYRAGPGSPLMRLTQCASSTLRLSRPRAPGSPPAPASHPQAAAWSSPGQTPPNPATASCAAVSRVHRGKPRSSSSGGARGAHGLQAPSADTGGGGPPISRRAPSSLTARSLDSESSTRSPHLSGGREWTTGARLGWGWTGPSSASLAPTERFPTAPCGRGLTPGGPHTRGPRRRRDSWSTPLPPCRCVLPCLRFQDRVVSEALPGPAVSARVARARRYRRSRKGFDRLPHSPPSSTREALKFVAADTISPFQAEIPPSPSEHSVVIL